MSAPALAVLLCAGALLIAAGGGSSPVASASAPPGAPPGAPPAKRLSVVGERILFDGATVFLSGACQGCQLPHCMLAPCLQVADTLALRPRVKVDGGASKLTAHRPPPPPPPCAHACAGANQPWLHYGSDFGNNRPSEVDFCTLKNDYLLPVQRAGGHTLRFWLFVEGSGGIPSWSADGSRVNGTDAAGSLAE